MCHTAHSFAFSDTFCRVHKQNARFVLQAWESDVESTIVSKLHSEVSAVMSGLNVPHDIERITEDGLFSADILIEDVKVIVEVDGPHHFTVNTHQPLGKLTVQGSYMLLRHASQKQKADLQARVLPVNLHSQGYRLLSLHVMRRKAVANSCDRVQVLPFAVVSCWLQEDGSC